jgi:signal peptidase
MATLTPTIPLTREAGRRRSSRVRRVSTLVVSVLLAAAWFVFLRPTVWGGPTSYVVVRGTSMLPTYEPGDLAVVWQASEYSVGDVVAYRVPDEFGDGPGFILIHRIIGGTSAEGFVLLGDNNQTEDVWYPTEADIVGRPLVRVPLVGVALAFLRSPMVLASVAAGIAVAVIFVPGAKSESQQTRSGRHRRVRGLWRIRLSTSHGTHVA